MDDTTDSESEVELSGPIFIPRKLAGPRNPGFMPIRLLLILQLMEAVPRFTVS